MSTQVQTADASYWRRANSLEEGRNQVLRLVARGEELKTILNLLCEKAQIYSPEMICSVLQLDAEHGTLHSAAVSSLPKEYAEAIDGVKIGSGVGSCGTAAFIKETVIVEDINTHPYWSQYKGLALDAGLQACWSEPIIGQNGKVFGTFAMYYAKPKAPSKEDLNFIEVSANLAAVVFENHENKLKLIEANNRLSQTVDKRTKELETANTELAQLIKEQQKLHLGNINQEKMITTNRLLCGFAHELNTPLGVATLASSSLADTITRLANQFKAGSLTQAEFEKELASIAEAASLNKANLAKMERLVDRFKKMDTLSSYTNQHSFSFADFVRDFQQACFTLLAQHELEFNFQDVIIQGSSVALSQILYQLVENSIVHGFAEQEHGRIHVDVKTSDGKVYINYQDDGCGVNQEQAERMFEPFYTANRSGSNVGLGLNVVKNIVTYNFSGSINLVPSPVGIRLELILSQEKTSP